MAKYLIRASYTPEGVRGILRDGGSKRRRVVEEAIGAVNGRVEAFYFGFEDADALVIIDAPDNVAAAALSLAVNAGGGARSRTTVLLTPEEIDEAAKKQIAYTPPGE